MVALAADPAAAAQLSGSSTIASVTPAGRSILGDLGTGSVSLEAERMPDGRIRVVVETTVLRRVTKRPGRAPRKLPSVDVQIAVSACNAWSNPLSLTPTRPIVTWQGRDLIRSQTLPEGPGRTTRRVTGVVSSNPPGAPLSRDWTDCAGAHFIGSSGAPLVVSEADAGLGGAVVFLSVTAPDGSHA